MLPLVSAQRPDINSPFLEIESCQPRNTPRKPANRPSSLSSHPKIYLPTIHHPWKPKTVFLCPVISLQIYCSLLKMLYKLEFEAITLSYSVFPGYLPCVHEAYVLINLFVDLLISFISGISAKNSAT